MQPLEPPNIHYLSAAIGWMELGNCGEALGELAKVDPDLALHPGVLEVKWTVCAAAKNWRDALGAAEQLVTADAGHPTGWLHRAYALRRVPQGGLQAAWDALLPAVDRFPQEPTIPYNLACYACQMGNLEEARRWLSRAFGVGDSGKLKSMSMADDDLKPLWPEIRSW